MKIYLIAALVGILAVGGILYSQYSKDSVQQEVVSDSESESETLITNGVYKGSILNLSQSGGSYICTVSSTANEVSSNGTVYISGKNIRADFESEVPMIGKVTTYMIANGEDVYTWSSMLSQGFKSAQTQNESAVSSESSVQSFDMNHTQTYTCDKTSVDNSQFEIPTDITFKELN